MPPEPKEDDLQASIADLLNAILPENHATWSHFPSGGYFLTPAARARLFRLGLRAGWPDVIICYGQGRVLWLEIKTTHGVLSIDQKRKHRQLWLIGHPVIVCRSVEDVLQALLDYSVPFHKTRVAGAIYGKVKQSAEASQPKESPQSAPAS